MRRKKTPTNPWRYTTHQQKVGMIIDAYRKGHVTICDITTYVSKVAGHKLQNYNINSVYRISIRNGGDLKNYPLVVTPKPTVGDVDLAEKLWRQGLTANDIAPRLGITRNQVYWLVERNRERFPLRVIRPGSTIVEQRANSVPFEHPDRIVRVTITGARITLPRVTILDGAPA